MYENHAIEDVSEFKTESLYINSEKVLENILLGNKEWEALVPKKAAQLIINEGLFGFSCQKSSQKKTG